MSIIHLDKEDKIILFFTVLLFKRKNKNATLIKDKI